MYESGQGRRLTRDTGRRAIKVVGSRYYLDAGFEDLGQAQVLGPENQDWTCTIFEASLPRIDTEVKGLRLVSLGPSQVDEYYQLVDRNRAHVTRHGDYEELGTATRDSVLADLKNDPDGAARFGIRFKGTLIGRVDLVPRDSGNYVLGYWLDQTQNGQRVRHSSVSRSDQRRVELERSRSGLA